MTAPCSCCTCQGVDRPTTGWRPLGMLGEHLVETCPALDCDTFTIHPADGRDALSWILDRLTELGCDPQPVGGAA